MASDLIDRQQLLDELEEFIEYDWTDLYQETPLINMRYDDLEKIICDQPTADVVEVVKCKDCVLHTNCFVEDHFKFVGLENPFCCVGKKVE